MFALFMCTCTCITFQNILVIMLHFEPTVRYTDTFVNIVWSALTNVDLFLQESLANAKVARDSLARQKRILT